MRNLMVDELDKYRDRSSRVIRRYGFVGDDTYGVFELPSPIDGAAMYIIASSGEGWDHVSVSRINRCPNWPEMDYAKRLFFLPTEVVMQLHVAESDHISVHPYCLHLWRPTEGPDIPLPPAMMVA